MKDMSFSNDFPLITLMMKLQNRGNILIIEIIGTDLFIARKAHEILADSNFIQGVSQKEIDIIEYIAASARLMFIVEN